MRYHRSGLQSTAILCTLGIVFLVLIMASPGGVEGASWKPLDLQYMVYRHSDLIIMGRIIEEKEGSVARADGSGRRIGAVEVAEVIYGPQDLKTVNLIMDSSLQGNQYNVGQQGIWFLKVASDADARPAQEALSGDRVPDPPQLGLDAPKQIFTPDIPRPSGKTRTSRSGRTG